MELPLIVEPERLAQSLGAENLLVVDLCKAETSASTQVPGAVRLEYASVIASRNPVGGLLPEASQLGSVLSALGLTPAHHLVAYDDEGGGKAGPPSLDPGHAGPWCGVAVERRHSCLGK